MRKLFPYIKPQLKPYVWSMLLKFNPVSRIAPYMFLQPIFGVALSLLLYPGEQVPLVRYGAALALVCASIVIINRGQHREAAADQA